MPIGHEIVSHSASLDRRWTAFDLRRRVVVHAEHVDRRADQREVTVDDVLVDPERFEMGTHVGWVLATQDRVEEDPVLQTVHDPRQLDLARVVGMGGLERPQVQGDADLFGTARPQHLDGQPVGEQQVVDRGDGRPRLGATGSVDAGGVAEQRRTPRLVECRPRRHPIAERIEHGRGVLGEPVGGVAAGPAAIVLERLGQVPVVERHPGCDVVLEQRVDQP